MGLMESEETFRKGFRKAGVKTLRNVLRSDMGYDDDDFDIENLTKAEIIEIMENHMGYNSGGDVKKKKKKVPVIAISVGMAEMPKNSKGKAKMMRGGTANKKEHMYSAGGSVTDKLNPGLRALQKERPDVVANILKKS